MNPSPIDLLLGVGPRPAPRAPESDPMPAARALQKIAATLDNIGRSMHRTSVCLERILEIIERQEPR